MSEVCFLVRYQLKQHLPLSPCPLGLQNFDFTQEHTSSKPNNNRDKMLTTP